MLTTNEAELMYPSLEGLAGLACAGCFDTCSCSSKGIGDIPWSCSQFGLFCQDPVVQAASDNSNYGKLLSQDARDRATSMAVTLVQGDETLNPPATDYTSLFVIGGVIVGLILIKKL